jgi:hypothetical protein
VIDAMGGAATFETGKNGYVRFDAAAANNGAKGLLVRSNYSHSGGKDAGAGFLREARGIELLSARKEAAPLVAGSLALRGRLYPETRGEKKRYMDLRALAAVRSDALPLLLAAEEETFREVETERAAWRMTSPTTEAVKTLSENAAGRALKAVDAAEAAVAKATATH